MTPATPNAAPVAARALPSLADAAPWLARFTPPFEFGSFFAPEDTVLCALAARAALGRAAARARARGDAPPQRVVELTAGSALVLADQLLGDRALRGWAAEVDAEAVARARRNLDALALGARARALRGGLFSPRLVPWLRRVRPDLVACNPPYVPEPPGAPLALAAGAGPLGARHPRRVLRACAAAGAPRVVLSWCSLGDPVGVAREARRAGYGLERLWAAVIADGEYSGEVHPYLRTLPTAFLAEDRATLAALAPDGAARFAYLLLAGSFVRAARPPGPGGVRGVARLVRAFRRDGLAAVERAHARGTRGLTAYVLDRAGELALRVRAHGP